MADCRSVMSDIPAVPASQDELPVNSRQRRYLLILRPPPLSSEWVVLCIHSHGVMGGGEGVGGQPLLQTKRGLRPFIKQISSTRHLHVHHSSSRVQSSSLSDVPEPLRGTGLKVKPGLRKVPPQRKLNQNSNQFWFYPNINLSLKYQSSIICE